MAIGLQGQATGIIDDDGNVLGWLPGGAFYRFGNEVDARIVASEVEISDRHVIDADNEFNLILSENDIQLAPQANRSAIIMWKAKQVFKKRNPSTQQPENDEPSEDDPFTLRCGREFVEVPFLRDERSKKLILNSAGDSFIPTPTKQVAIRTYALTRKEWANPCAKADMYENVVNSDTWNGANPGTLLMTSIDPEWGGNIWTVTYNYRYRKDGWGEKYLDTGFYKLYGSDKKRVPILNKDGQTPVTEPAKLDGSGDVLPEDNEDGVSIPTEESEYFLKYDELSFAALRMPNPYSVTGYKPQDNQQQEGGQ